MTPVAAHSTATKDEALYVYCVVRGSTASSPPSGDSQHVLGPIGLDGQLVYTVGCGTLRAVVHACQAQPYQSQVPQIVEGWAIAHQNVVRAATEVFGTVLPMAFDMIVRAGEDVSAVTAMEAWLDEKRPRFSGLLDRLAGQAEYGVQVFWDREAIASELMSSEETFRAMRDEIQTKPKGLAHLLSQKLAKAIRTAMEQQADLSAQDFYARIRQCVTDLRVDPLKKADGAQQMLLNLSCLMREGSEDLGRVLDEIQQTKGITVRFTGPWPPYSFVGG